MIGPALLLQAILCGAPASDSGPSSVAGRIDASARAGTGGSTAAFARCNPEAVVHFFDGHQTPELIPEPLLWWHVLVVEPAEPPLLSGRGQRQFAEERTKLANRIAAFQTESRALAKQIAKAATSREAATLRQRSYELSERMRREAEVAAAQSLTTLRKNLAATDRVPLAEWLCALRRTSVILEMDYAKVTDWECEKRSDH